MARPLKDINIEIGARIKQQRKAQSLSREELAKLSGYSTNFVQEVERGRSGLSSESMRALSVALKTSADSLLFGCEAEDFSYVARLLATVPADKRKHIIRIIEEAVECTQPLEAR
ncbi:helix-turn-helix domain-containing protein [Acutalibacter muris]|uniref:helix-turn-helix domain-containing protein n=1 Tax=Acutalibacter muris TaxID=1796620 RepID=UPI00272E2AB2|nr:helix-turn-helix transcriptional regulator [Acutalibacter muris]